MILMKNSQKKHCSFAFFFSCKHTDFISWIDTPYPFFSIKFLCPTYDSRGALCFLVCASVCSFLRLCLVRSSHCRLKFLVKVVVDEVEVQSTCNLVHMFPMIWSFLIICQIIILTPISWSTEHRKWKCKVQVKVFGQGSFWWS